MSKDILENTIESEIHCNEYGSDHCPVSLVLNIKDIDLESFKELSQHCKKDSDESQSKTPEKEEEENKEAQE